MNRTPEPLFLCSDRRDTRWFPFAVNGIFTTLLVVFGTCGSIHSILSIGRKNKNLRLAQYLLVLCFWDVLLLLSTFGFYGFVVLVYGHKPWHGWCAYFYLVFYPLIHVAMSGSMWMVVAITFERCFALSSPLRQRVGQRQRVRRVCLGIVGLALLFNIPATMELTVKTCYLDDISAQPIIATSELRNNKVYQLVYRVFCYSLFNGPGPFVLVLVLTLRTLSFRKIALDGQRTTASLRRNSVGTEILNIRESNAVTLLTAVIVKYLICYTAPTVFNIIEFVDRKLINSEPFLYVVDLSNLLVVVHSATNWVIFCQWRKPARMPRTTRRISFPTIEARLLHATWSELDPQHVGIEILVEMINQNPSLAKHFQKIDLPPVHEESATNSPALSRQPLLACRERQSSLLRKISSRLSLRKHDISRAVSSHGCVIGDFLNDIVNDLADFENEQNTLDTIDRMRNIGTVHYNRGVNLKNSDWMLFKELLVVRLLRECPTSRDKNVANRFVSMLIHEIKCGFVCQAVMESTL